MEKDIYNKIAITCQNIGGRFYTFQYNWGMNSFYKVYDKRIFDKRKEQFEILTQLTNFSYKEFFKKEHLSKSYYGEPYLEGKAVIIEEDKVSVHGDMYPVLFHYLCDKFSSQINELLEVLKSEDYQTKFRGIAGGEKYMDSYYINYHEEISGYFGERIEKYPMLFHLFNQTGTLIIADERKIIFKTNQIKGIVENLQEMYSFENIELI